MVTMPSSSPCSVCGSVMADGARSLPAGQRVCRSCRGWQANRAQRPCEWCGALFKGRHQRGASQSVCSRACADANRYNGCSTPVPWADCRSCSLPFIRHRRREYCSEVCRLSRPATPPVLRTCPRCEGRFTCPSSNGRPRVWCPPCREAVRRATRKAAEAKRRRRAGSSVVVVSADVFARDGWRCQLCRRKVDRRRVVPHPLAPTLDHIVPLARGGSHDTANLQCAHFICNSRKGAAGSQQLRLIG